LTESRVCCGFGGSFSFDYPAISERLMNRKLDDIDATGALEVVTDNQGCIMQIRGGSDAQGRAFRVRHIAELLAEGIAATAAANGVDASPSGEVDGSASL
jgi:Fe-S oxidoreductase